MSNLVTGSCWAGRRLFPREFGQRFISPDHDCEDFSLEGRAFSSSWTLISIIFLRRWRRSRKAVKYNDLRCSELKRVTFKVFHRISFHVPFILHSRIHFKVLPFSLQIPFNFLSISIPFFSDSIQIPFRLLSKSVQASCDFLAVSIQFFLWLLHDPLWEHI